MLFVCVTLENIAVPCSLTPPSFQSTFMLPYLAKAIVACQCICLSTVNT